MMFLNILTEIGVFQGWNYQAAETMFAERERQKVERAWQPCARSQHRVQGKARILS